MSAEHYDLGVYTFSPCWDGRRGVHHTIEVKAGRPWTEEIGPPEWRREVTRWPHTIQVSISPTGRSVQVFVDGEKVL